MLSCCFDVSRDKQLLHNKLCYTNNESQVGTDSLTRCTRLLYTEKLVYRNAIHHVCCPSWAPPPSLRPCGSANTSALFKFCDCDGAADTFATRCCCCRYCCCCCCYYCCFCCCCYCCCCCHCCCCGFGLVMKCWGTVLYEQLVSHLVD